MGSTHADRPQTEIGDNVKKTIFTSTTIEISDTDDRLCAPTCSGFPFGTALHSLDGFNAKAPLVVVFHRCEHFKTAKGYPRALRSTPGLFALRRCQQCLDATTIAEGV